jgi:ribonuclease P protein component
MQPAADNNIRYTFKKHDRLKSSLAIEVLYRENRFIVSYPLKCYYSFSEIKENESLQRVAFTVPKKTFKHAVDRNSIKRRMREAYRLNFRKFSETVNNKKDKHLKLFFIYIGKDMLDYKTIEKNIRVVFEKLSKNVVSL